MPKESQQPSPNELIRQPDLGFSSEQLNTALDVINRSLGLSNIPHYIVEDLIRELEGNQLAYANSRQDSLKEEQQRKRRQSRRNFLGSAVKTGAVLMGTAGVIGFSTIVTQGIREEAHSDDLDWDKQHALNTIPTLQSTAGWVAYYGQKNTLPEFTNDSVQNVSGLWTLSQHNYVRFGNDNTKIKVYVHNTAQDHDVPALSILYKDKGVGATDDFASYILPDNIDPNANIDPRAVIFQKEDQKKYIQISLTKDGSSNAFQLKELFPK